MGTATLAATLTAAMGCAVVADGIPQPLTAVPGSAERGRALVADRQKSLCLLCHAGPFPNERTPATVSTALQGAGSRWTEAQLRLRVADARALNPDSLMPSFHKADGGDRVAAAYRGKPILSAQEVEDVVAVLRSLR
jgi:L-cysteine S-thiosulfotransferase